MLSLNWCVKYLIVCRFSWSKTTLVWSNDAVQIWFQSVTENDGLYFVGCDSSSILFFFLKGRVFYYDIPFRNLRIFNIDHPVWSVLFRFISKGRGFDVTITQFNYSTQRFERKICAMYNFVEQRSAIIKFCLRNDISDTIRYYVIFATIVVHFTPNNLWV